MSSRKPGDAKELLIPESIPAIETMMLDLQREIRTIQGYLDTAPKRESGGATKASEKWFHGATQALRIKRAQEQRVREALGAARKQERITRSKTLAEHFLEEARDSLSRADFEDLLSRATQRLPEYMRD